MPGSPARSPGRRLPNSKQLSRNVPQASSHAPYDGKVAGVEVLSSWTRAARADFAYDPGALGNSTDPYGGSDLHARLLTFLREKLAAPQLVYAEPPAHMPGGATVHVHAFRLASAPEKFSGPLVVRIWRAPGRSDEAAYESSFQNALAELGYPVPRVLSWCDDATRLGASFQVMERVAGKPLLRAGNHASEDADASLLRELLPDLGALLFRDWPGRLAHLHAELHELNARYVVQQLAMQGFDPGRIQLGGHLDRLEATIDSHGLKELRPALDWLQAHAPSEREDLAICHGDLFPNQVFVDGERLTVIDWSEALLAPAEIDVGGFCCGLETAPIPLPGPLQRLGLEVQRWFTRRFLRAYRSLRAVDADWMRYGGVFHAVQTLVGVAVRRLALAGAIAETPRPNPYDTDLGVQLLRRYLRSTVSVEVEFPW